MGMGVQRRTFNFSAEDIDSFSEWLGNMCEEAGVERQSRMRVRLLMEDILICMRSHFDASEVFQVTFDARLRYVRHPKLTIEVDGHPFNPLGTADQEMGDWDSALRIAVGLNPQYSYDGTRNVLNLRIPSTGMSAVFWILFAIAVGVIVGVLGDFLMPFHMQNAITEVLFKPTYDMWLRLLNAISGPVIFLTVITTMLNTLGITRRGGNSVLVIVRYFVLSIASVFNAALISMPFHVLKFRNISVDRSLLSKLYDSVLKIVPHNIFEPFIESNTSQLLFLAFVLGYVLIKLGEKTKRLNGIIRDSNIVGLRLAGWMSRLVPLFAGVFICMGIWQRDSDVTFEIYRPLALALLISAGVLIIMALYTSWRMRTSPLTLARKLWPTFRVALKTGSLDDSYGEAMTCCTRYMGIEQEYANETLPQGLVLYMPISAIGTIVYTMYAAQVNSVDADAVWYVTAIVMAVVLFVATPPVPGANLLAYVVLFNSLGIPEDALLDAMTFDIVFGIFAGAANQAMLQLEMVYQAARFGLIDLERLRKPMS